MCIVKQQPTRTATEITQTAKTSSDQSIDLCILRDTYHKLFCLWRFLCVRNAGHGGNKITAMKDQLQAKKMMRKGFLFYASWHKC